MKVPRARSASLLLLATLLSAQTAPRTRKVPLSELPASASKLISVVVKGSKIYAPADIIAAAGLQIGQTISEDDFKTACRHLGETGALSEVMYSYEYSPEGTKLTLLVTEATQIVPASLDNFVWFSDDELKKQLHERVPLFNGELPVNGNLAEQVSNALQSLLIERGVQGEANYLKVAQQDGPVTGFSFSVTGPTILIRNVVFNGAADEELPALESAARKVSRVEYSRSALRAQAEKDFLPIYLARGYLKAKFSDAQPSVVQSTPVEALVDVTFNVSPGLQYKAGTVEWSGNKAFPADLLGPMLNLRPGQPVDAVRLDKDLKAVQDVYGTKGYLAVSIRPIARMDDEHATANYQLQVEEGEVYVMGELDIEGVDSRTTPHLVENWKLRAGDTYDSSYPQRFYKESADLLPGTNWKMTVHQSLNRDKSVDVTLRFEPPPGGP